MSILRLKLPTDPRWVNIVEKNIQEILTDHAFCEQKAASNAITLIVRYPEFDDMVTQMSALAMEEMEHFQRVHALILERGWSLGRERKDDYVNQLLQFVRKDGSRIQSLIERLLLGAMIEARSCERFKVLSENVPDEKLAAFYRELMESEAGHYTLFITLARQYGAAEKIDVDARWREFLEYESEIIQQYGNSERIHG